MAKVPLRTAMPHPAPEKIVGIIGGMGPEATVDLMQRVIRLTPAKDDSAHIRCLVDDNPKIPSRIKALIEGTGESPGPAIAATAKNLESWGADFIAIPCNTAHYYHAEAQAAVSIPCAQPHGAGCSRKPAPYPRLAHSRASRFHCGAHDRVIRAPLPA